jgi:hypothetical protein
VDVVDRTVRRQVPDLREPRRGVERAERLHDVVLDQRIAGPAVDGEEPSAGRSEVA